MNSTKSYFIVLVLSLIILITMCATIIKKTDDKYISSSIEDKTFIPDDLINLNSENLLKEITKLGIRVSSSKGNAKAGKLIKTYFEGIGLDPYKNDSYYNSFDLKEGTPFIEKATGNESNFFNGTLENVIGKINGEDNSKAIIVSAHFDTFINTVGVLDNTSGVIALLKIAKEISTKLKNKKFPVDILFVAFNGEENGLLGSSSLVKDLKNMYTDFYNINIDCAGLENKPLAYKNKHEESNELYESLGIYIDKYKIYRDPELDYMTIHTSDHIPFQNAGKAAITIRDSISDNLIHTPDDNNLNLIDHDKLMNLVNAISNFILEGNGKIY